MATRTYAIYRQRTHDPSSEQVYLGDVAAATMSDALDQASQFYEYPQHDLLAVQVVEPTTLQKCPYCRGWHQPQDIEQCQLKP